MFFKPTRFSSKTLQFDKLCQTITHNIHLVLTDFINMKMACTLMKNKISLGQSILISPQIKLLMTFFGLADLSLGLNIEVLMGMIEMYFQGYNFLLSDTLLVKTFLVFIFTAMDLRKIKCMYPFFVRHCQLFDITDKRCLFQWVKVL